MTPLVVQGGAEPWRDATFALVAIILIGALVFRRDRGPVTIAFVLVGAVAALGLAIAQSRVPGGGASMTSMQGASGSAPVPVTVARVIAGEAGAAIAAPANIEPYLVQNLVARAPGLLTGFSAYTGDRLHAGETVARLDEPELQANARAAQETAASMTDQISSYRANLRYWSEEIVRERYLLANGAVSAQEYQYERAQATAARAQYESALAQSQAAAETAQSQEITASYTSVIVPDDGVVMKRLVDPGVYVQAGTPILQMAVIDRLRVRAQVAQQNLAAVRVGTPIEVTFDNGRVLDARISSISPVVNPETHTAIAEAIVPNPGDALQPGAFAHAMLHLEVPRRANAFVVPSAALVGGTTPAVWEDRNSTAHRVPVRVISDDGTHASVTGNLRPGDRVVVTGASGLEEGQAIAPASP